MNNNILKIDDLYKTSIIELNSNKPWKITTIMAWVHWNELAWIKAINDILCNICIDSWKVIFIIANLKAIEICQRQFEKNMNRCFFKNNLWNTYEDKRVNEIIEYLNGSDYLLDIHNTLNTKNSVPFLISEHKELWKYFDVDIVISWFDELHPGWSDWYMNNIWKIWLCLESWSIYDPRWYEIAKNWIINFLKFTNNISWDYITSNKQEFIKFDKIFKNQSLNFWFVKEFLDFEKITKWQIIAYDWDKEIFSDRNWYIVFTYIPKNIWDECFCIWNTI